MLNWVQLSGWLAREVIMNVCLKCVSKLQRVIDSKFSQDQWEALSAEEAVDPVGDIVCGVTNKVVLWD